MSLKCVQTNGDVVDVPGDKERKSSILQELKFGEEELLRKGLIGIRVREVNEPVRQQEIWRAFCVNKLFSTESILKDHNISKCHTATMSTFMVRNTPYLRTPSS